MNLRSRMEWYAKREDHYAAATELLDAPRDTLFEVKAARAGLQPLLRTAVCLA